MDEKTDATIGVADIYAMVRRQALLMAWLAAPIVVLGIALALALPDEFRSAAFFELRNDTTVETGRQPRLEYPDRFVQSIKDRVLSAENRRQVVDLIDPYAEQDLPDDAAAGALYRDTKIAMVTENVLDPYSSRQRPIYTGFVLSYTNPDPDKAHAVSRWLADAFLAESRQFKADQAAKSSEFLASQVERARGLIAAREAELAQFKTENFGRLPELAQANANALERAETDLRRIQQELSAVRQNRVFVMQRLQELELQAVDTQDLRTLEEEYRRAVAIYSPTHPDVVSLRRQVESLRASEAGGVGSSLAQQLAAERQVLEQARQRYSEEHPDVKRSLRRIEALESALAAGGVQPGTTDDWRPARLELQTQLKSLDTRINALEEEAASLRQKRSEFEGRLASTPDVEKEYLRVVRGLESARGQYDELARQQLEAELLVASVLQGRADLFQLTGEPTVPPVPSGPRRMARVIASLVAAAVVAMGAAIAAELFSTTVRSARDVVMAIGIAPLVTVPRVRSPNHLQKQLIALGALVVVGGPMLYLALRYLVG